MAKGKLTQLEITGTEVKATAPAKPWSGAPRGYVNADISKAEATDYAVWWDTFQGQDAWDELVKLADNGYRITISEGEKGFKASATNVEGPMGSRGLCLSGYGSDAGRCLGSLLYKHLVKLSGDWGDGDAPEDTYVR
jgi:hypothetical protein